MFKLLLFIVSHKSAVVESSCTDFGLDEVESETLRKLQMFGFRYCNELCVLGNQYIAVENDEILPTCVGYSPPPYLQFCDSSALVCCGSGSTQGTFGYPGSHKECLETAFTQDSRRHPSCPFEIPSDASGITHAPSFSPSLSPTQTPSKSPSIASISITLTLVNVDGHNLAKPENIDLLYEGIQQISSEVEEISVLQVEQFVDFSVIIIDILPPIFLSPEDQSELTDWILEENPSLAIRQTVQETNEETGYWLLLLLLICAFLLMCLLCFLCWNMTSKDEAASKIVVDMVEYIDSNARAVHSPGRLAACSPGRIASEAVAVINEGGDFLNPGYMAPPQEGRQRWTMEGILPNLPEENSIALPDPGSIFPTTPTNQLSPTTATSDSSMPSVQTDSYELYTPIYRAQKGAESTLKYKI